MSEKTIQPSTFEIVRDRNVSADVFKEGLETIGFFIVKDYASLPLNYRVQAVQLTDEQATIALDKFSLSFREAQNSADKITAAALTTKIVNPIAATEGFFTNQSLAYRNWTDEFGAGWQYPSQCLENFEDRPFTTAIAGDYVTDVKLTGNGVDFYIVDTGVDPDHEEFNTFEYGYRTKLVAGGDDFYNTGEDDNNHGTGMATCAVGRTIGLAIDCRVFWAKALAGDNSGNGGALIDAVDALVTEYGLSADGRPGVMNNSWTGGPSAALEAAVDAAVDAGMVMVASAGNSRRNISSPTFAEYPAYYNDVLSIGALDLDFKASDFSNYGTSLDGYTSGRTITQGARGNCLRWGNGTSPASAITSGIICCLLQGYAKPANRADVLAVYAHVKALSKDARTFNAFDTEATTKKVFRLPLDEQWDITRIAGLRNLLSQKRSKLGGGSVQKQATTISGLSAGMTATLHPKRSPHIDEVFIGLPTPIAVSNYDGLKPWLSKNDTFAGLYRRASQPPISNVLCIQRRYFNRHRGIGNYWNFFFVPSRSTANSYLYQTVPLDMTPDSNPKSLFEVFTNLAWDTGDTTGWTTSGAGTVNIKTGNGDLQSHTGGFFFEASGGASVTLSQVKDLAGFVNFDKVDAGKVKLLAECVAGTSFLASPNDEGQVVIIALNSVGADISTVFDTGVMEATGSVLNWDAPGFQNGLAKLPVGTRQLRIEVRALFVAGTIINCPIDSICGWLYEQTTEGDRILNSISDGNAEALWSLTHRTIQLVKDDRGRQELWFWSPRGLGDEIVGGYRSPFYWVQHWHRGMVPQDAYAVQIRMRGNRRSGTVTNYHFKDNKLEIRQGLKARAVASYQSQNLKGGGRPTVTNTGFATNVSSGISNTV